MRTNTIFESGKTELIISHQGLMLYLREWQNTMINIIFARVAKHEDQYYSEDDMMTKLTFGRVFRVARYFLVRFREDIK